MKIEKYLTEATYDSIAGSTLGKFRQEDKDRAAEREETLKRLKVAIKDALRNVPEGADQATVDELRGRMDQIDSMLNGLTVDELRKDAENSKKDHGDKKPGKNKDGKPEDGQDSADSNGKEDNNSQAANKPGKGDKTDGKSGKADKDPLGGYDSSKDNVSGGQGLKSKAGNKGDTNDDSAADNQSSSKGKSGGNGETGSQDSDDDAGQDVTDGDSSGGAHDAPSKNMSGGSGQSSDGEQSGSEQDGEGSGNGDTDMPDDVENPFRPNDMPKPKESDGNDEDEEEQQPANSGGSSSQNDGEQEDDGQQGHGSMSQQDGADGAEGQQAQGQQNKGQQQEKPKKKDPTADQILKMLKAELTNEDSKRGAIDALTALLADRHSGVKESLTEARQTIDTMSDDEYGDFVNSTLDLLDKLGTNIHIEGEDEITTRMNAVKRIASPFGKASLEQEQQADTLKKNDVERKVRARKKRDYTYLKTVKSVEQLEIDIKKTVKEMVKPKKKIRRSYSTPDEVYSGTGLLMKGDQEYLQTPKDAPVIDFFFDRSSSWGGIDSVGTVNGLRVASKLAEFQKQKLIVLNIYYFSDRLITKDPTASGLDRGTRSWEAIMDKIKTDGAKNVLLMTDHDMDDQAAYGTRLQVDGHVWFLWADSSVDLVIARALTGKLGTDNYGFAQS